MDAIDVGIIRAMDVRPYGDRPKDPEALKPSRIARALGTTHVTVRERVARMEDAGVIAGYQLYPNLRHLGLAASAFLVRVPDEDDKARALKAVEDVEGLFEVHNFLGAEACVDVTYADGDLDAREAALERIRAATGDAEPMALYERRMPPVSRPLSSLDWRILHALRGQARRPLPEVADEVGVSPRTVRRHYDRMASEGSFFAVPTLDLSRLDGLIPFFLNFHTARDLPQAALHAALGAFEERRIHTYYPVDRRLGHFGLMVFARSVADMEDLRVRALGIQDVVRVAPWVYRGWLERSEWMDGAVRARAAAG